MSPTAISAGRASRGACGAGSRSWGRFAQQFEAVRKAKSEIRSTKSKGRQAAPARGWFRISCFEFRIWPGCFGSRFSCSPVVLPIDLAPAPAARRANRPAPAPRATSRAAQRARATSGSADRRASAPSDDSRSPSGPLNGTVPDTRAWTARPSRSRTNACRWTSFPCRRMPTRSHTASTSCNTCDENSTACPLAFACRSCSSSSSRNRRIERVRRLVQDDEGHLRDEHR